MPPRYVLFVLSLFFLPGASGCATYYNPATQRRETAWLSLDQERSIAHNTLGSILHDKEIVPDQRAVRVTDRLVRAIESPRIPQKTIIVYEDKNIQAFTPGGGYVVLTTGLLASATEDELAAVIAHEIGHDEARHVMKMVESRLGAQVIMNIAYLLDRRSPDRKGRTWDNLLRASNIIYSLAANGFSRRDEYEADRLSIRYMYQAGYDPDAIVTFLEKLQQLGNDKNWVYFLRSHPYLHERIEAAREEIKKYEQKTSGKEMAYF